MKEFTIETIPFLGCDFSEVYPVLVKIIPKEKTVFSGFPFSCAILCEIICAALCHQMNWDFLREVIFYKTQENINWLTSDYLANITDNEVGELFRSYNKPERIRKEERASILRDLGKWLSGHSYILEFSSNNRIDTDQFYSDLCTCPFFSEDPERKKLQLLFQKLSQFPQLAGLANYYHPAIDYHLIRNYLRRGLLYTNSKRGIEYIKNSDVRRKESTTAALRKLCSEVLLNICEYTGLDVPSINQVEWHIGRSVCVQDKPDCNLIEHDSQWLKPVFKTCPFYNTCAARCYNRDYLQLNEPKYTGTSY